MNDSFGHEAGDLLLTEVGERLRLHLRRADTAARLGGDEFAILLEDVTDDRYAELLSEKLLEAFTQPYSVGGKQFLIKASVGIATSSGEQVSASDLLRNADIAMYEAKRGGGGRYDRYSQDMYLAALDRIELLGDLQRALEKSQFEILYQPTVALASGRIEGFEALIRWNHPTRGTLPPQAFIGLAEESGLIVPIGEWS